MNFIILQKRYCSSLYRWYFLWQGNPRDEVLANRLLEFLMKHSFHPKRAVFRHNLEIIRTLVECWKDCLHVPYR